MAIAAMPEVVDEDKLPMFCFTRKGEATLWRLIPD